MKGVVSMKRERCGAVVWAMRLHAWRGSGLSLSAYCRYAGWSYATARAWRSRWVRELLGPLPRFGVAP